MDYDFSQADVWVALESLHGLPLTTRNSSQPWQLHASEAVTLVYVDKFRDDLVPVLVDLNKRRAPAFVYAWASGQVRDALTQAIDGTVNIEVLGVRDSLVRRFRQ